MNKLFIIGLIGLLLVSSIFILLGLYITPEVTHEFITKSPEIISFIK